MTTEEKNELAQKLANIDETASSMWYAAEYPENNEICSLDFYDSYDSISKEITKIRKMLGIPEPVEVD